VTLFSSRSTARAKSNGPICVDGLFSNLLIKSGTGHKRLRCVPMEELDRRKNEALVAVTLCTGTLIACFGIVLAML
jgi:hypothetical protein